MHPLSTFPALLTFGMVAPVILRISASLFIFSIAKERYNKNYKWSSVVYLISAVLLFLGLYTQIAAIIGIGCIKFDFWVDRKNVPISKERKFLDSIVIIILISLLFTGPGFLAFDLPL